MVKRIVYKRGNGIIPDISEAIISASPFGPLYSVGVVLEGEEKSDMDWPEAELAEGEYLRRIPGLFRKGDPKIQEWIDKEGL